MPQNKRSHSTADLTNVSLYHAQVLGNFDCLVLRLVPRITRSEKYKCFMLENLPCALKGPPHKNTDEVHIE